LMLNRQKVPLTRLKSYIPTIPENIFAPY